MSDTTRLNRRRFLRYGTLATTGTLALPAIVPRRVLGFDGTPGANEEIVLGIIGMDCIRTGVDGAGLAQGLWGGGNRVPTNAVASCHEKNVSV